ncbi:MAG: LytTR family DNA-binding domain-containing protein [Bacteroidota bacterium]
MYDRFLNINNNRKVKYLHWSIILVISLIIGHLIVTESQTKPVLVLVHQFNYQMAMAFSWPFTFLLMLWIHYCTKKLDVYVPWTTKWSLRIVMQFLFGVVFVLLMDVIIVKSYFVAFNNDFERSGYMEIEFPIVRWMVLFMNALYIAWFFAVNYYNSTKMNDGLKDYITNLNDQKEQESHTQRIEAKLGKKIIQVELNEIACFEREENIGYVYLLDGRKFNMDLKLNELSRLVDSSSFYQINRSVMISFKAIKGYEKVKNQQARIILQNDLDLYVSLLVSRERYDGFKKQFEAFKLR